MVLYFYKLCWSKTEALPASRPKVERTRKIRRMKDAVSLRKSPKYFPEPFRRRNSRSSTFNSSMEERPRQEDGEHSVSTSVAELDNEEEEDPTPTKSQFKSSPSRPWKCPVCNWYLATSKSTGCPYCAMGTPPPSRDKEKEHPATSKQREEDRAVSRKRLVNVWNVGQSKSILPLLYFILSHSFLPSRSAPKINPTL